MANDYNSMKKLSLILFTMIFIFLSVDADAQRKRRTKKRERDKEKIEYSDQNFWQSLNKEIKPGYGLGGQGSSNYIRLGVSLKANVGTQLGKVFSTGLGGKAYYTYINYRFSNQSSDHLLDYGAFAYLRGKFLERYYLQAEYNVTKLASYGTFPSRTFYYPAIGGGYINPLSDKWSVGTEVMININEDFVDYGGDIIELWINFSYNF